MRKIFVILALIALSGMVLAFEMPSEVECANEVKIALENIEKGRRNLAGSDYISCGSCYENRKEYDKALDCYLKSAETYKSISDGRAAVAYEAAGDAYKALGNEEKAKEYYNLALQNFNKDKDAWFIKDIYLKLGDYENACKYCKMDGVSSYEDCVKAKYCNAASFSSSSSGGLGSGSNGGLPLILVAVGIVFLIAIAGLFLMKKKKK